MPDKGELESHREETFIDDIIQKSHIEKELLSHLDGIKTVFDGGAGCGEDGFPDPMWSVLLYVHAIWVAQRRHDLSAVDAHRLRPAAREEH